MNIHTRQDFEKEVIKCLNSLIPKQYCLASAYKHWTLWLVLTTKKVISAIFYLVID